MTQLIEETSRIHERYSMKMKQLVFLSALIITSIASAAQFESVFDAMAIESSSGNTNIGWEDVAKIKGVNWRWPSNESGAHSFTMKGETKTDKNPKYVPARIAVSGSRTKITSIDIDMYAKDIPQQNHLDDIDVIGKGKLTKFQTSCDEEDDLGEIEFLKFEKLGYKPLYFRRISSVDGYFISISYTPDSFVERPNKPCKVLR